jgi:hypothetical protein
MKRYTLHITLRNGVIKENYKSLSEVISYKDIIDDTVIRAYVIDNSNGSIKFDWK